ncbi:putative aldose 1-epimerase [Golovinomyces cichoracearum]|uniref:Putative aldose 1-epimerase n=1 Tax=Golovinomyces cichoracearum TaxID=62708 RepID=A0A420J819_9PEZI|nr:putative aldose 1-epimerase [Golovinomyces cichoracearum]
MYLILLITAAAIFAHCRASHFMPNGDSSHESSLGPDSNGKYTIQGLNIRASFVPYGASISNLYINDTRGIERDIVAGWDNASYYSIDRQHPHFGGVPGRYANRIKNSSFVIDGKKWSVQPNENPTVDHPDGVDTLHGGPNGWDWRNWTLVSLSENSITFSLIDSDGNGGFPGKVISYVTYTLRNMTWDFKMTALSTTNKTPIMLSSHTYWNLDGFANNETTTALNHTLWLPYAGQRVGTDTILVPTGDIIVNKQGDANDFWSTPKQMGTDMASPTMLGNCGYGCTGYDTCFINNLRNLSLTENWSSNVLPVAQIQSSWSGIQLDVFTNQDAIQIYSCNGQNGSVTLKSTQGTPDERFIQQYGCIVLEPQDWIDGINHPEWGRKQIWGPEDDDIYTLEASYRFSLISKMPT